MTKTNYIHSLALLCLLKFSFQQILYHFLLRGKIPSWAFSSNLAFSCLPRVTFFISALCPTLSSLSLSMNLVEPVYILQYLPEQGCLGSKFVETADLKMPLLLSLLIASLCRLLLGIHLSSEFWRLAFWPLDFLLSRLLLKSEAILIPHSLYMTLFIFFLSQDSYRLFALSPMFWNFILMCHGWILFVFVYLGPFNLETSGFISGIFFLEH